MMLLHESLACLKYKLYSKDEMIISLIDTQTVISDTELNNNLLEILCMISFLSSRHIRQMLHLLQLKFKTK